MKNLGKKARDKVTGFEGIIISKISYLTGCDQYGLAPPAKDGKTADSGYFDTGRVEIIGDGVTVHEVASDKNGGHNHDAPRA